MYRIFKIRPLFSSEGKGSLHYFLKAKGWVTSISAGVGDEGMHKSSIAYIFGMSIHLTDSGLEKVVVISNYPNNYATKSTCYYLNSCLALMLLHRHLYVG